MPDAPVPSGGAPHKPTDESTPRLDAGRREFFERVFPTELQDVAARRQALGIDTSRLGAGEPRTDRDLVGLALSGGGIRSATIALGAVQALARRGALKAVDYLSTVSGGGYTGSMLSSVLNDPTAGVDGNAFPLNYEPGQVELPAMRQLRNGSNYLASGGMLNELRLPMVVLRGLMLNALLVMPYIALAALLTCIGFPFVQESGAVSVVVWLLMAFFLAMMWSFPLVSYLFGKNRSWNQRDRVENLQAIALLLCLVAVGLSLTSALVSVAMASDWAEMRSAILTDLRIPAGRGDVVSWLAVAAGGYLLARFASPETNLRHRFSRLLLYVIGFAGPALMVGTYLFLLLIFGRSPFIEAKHDITLNDAALSVPPVLNDEELRRQLAARGVGSVDTSARGPRSSVYVLRDAAARNDTLRWVLIDSTSVVDSIRGSDTSRSVHHERRFTAHLESNPDIIHIRGNEFGAPGFRGDWWLAGIGLLVFILNAIWVDVNVTGPHGFWRDRLSRVFLFRSRGKGAPEANDTQQLSDLGSRNPAVPYHIVNTSLNLTGSKLEDLPGRGSDFFMFSRRFVGSYATGYCTTAAMQKADPHVNLGTAMAISAAATAPNSGTVTVKPLVFMLTLLNIRLDYWVPNPQEVDADSEFRRAWARVTRPGMRYLLLEAFGLLHARGTYVNLSDGGHIENLAIYELLRRRCKVIVCSDGEQDQGMTCASLAKLIRYARIDLGIEITVDLSPFRLDPATGMTQGHWTVGTIRYSADETGYLLYVKSAVTGDEAPYVLDYRSRNPTFPQESTSDQFFDEAQFESYRALGYHAMNHALGTIAGGDATDPARGSREALDALRTGLGLRADRFSAALAGPG